MGRFAIALLSTTALSAGLVQVASAADIPARGRAPAYQAPPPMAYDTWSGFYIGGNVGGAWGTSRLCTDATIGLNCSAGDRVDHDLSGWLGGGQVGGRIQTGPVVFGIEGMFAGADI